MRKFAAWLLLSLMAAVAAAQTPYLAPTAIAMTFTPPGGQTPPAFVSALGFNTLTYTTTSFSATNVDVADDCVKNFTTAGAHCAYQFFLYRASGANPLVGDGHDSAHGGAGSCASNVTFSSGVLVLLGCATGPNGQLATATPNVSTLDATSGTSGTNWRGTAFGCGAYMEFTAVMSAAISGGNTTNRKNVDGNNTPGSGGWQALWAQPYEFSILWNNSFANSGWPGQASNYIISNEDDFFELTSTTAGSEYGAAEHMAYGVFNSTCTGYCQMSSKINRAVTGTYVASNSYRYGALWVPATASTSGYVRFYRNEVAQSGVTQSWTQFTGQSPSVLPATNSATCTGLGGSGSSNCVGATSPTWLYGVHDSYHYVPIIGTGTGDKINGGVNDPPVLNISKINIWQGSGACNLSH